MSGRLGILRDARTVAVRRSEASTSAKLPNDSTPREKQETPKASISVNSTLHPCTGIIRDVWRCSSPFGSISVGSAVDVLNVRIQRVFEIVIVSKGDKSNLALVHFDQIPTLAAKALAAPDPKDNRPVDARLRPADRHVPRSRKTIPAKSNQSGYCE
jgi:hypothetical protein